MQEERSEKGFFYKLFSIINSDPLQLYFYGLLCFLNH